MDEQKSSASLVQPKRWKQWSKKSIIGLALCAIVYVCVLLYTRWTDPDREITLVNFLVAWWPFAVSIFAAFIPDIDKRRSAGMIWRIGIIVAGFFYSILLWHQQSLLIKTAREDQAKIVGAAVSQSNEHSDKGIVAVRSDLKDATAHSDQQIGSVKGDLKAATTTLSELVAKMQSGLDASISKVGKPEPPVPPKLRFTLWTDDPKVKMPLTVSSLDSDKDGVFNVDFTFQNVSSVPAEKIDIWIYNCIGCTYFSEPSGFDKPKGMDDSTRHKMIPGYVNPGSSLEKMTVSVKPPNGIQAFDVAFRYSCATCGGMSEAQELRILALPKLIK